MSIKTLLLIPVLAVFVVLALQLFFSPRLRILNAGGELHTIQTFGFDLNGNSWYGVLGKPPAEISPIHAAVFPLKANFDKSIAYALNQIETLEYLAVDGGNLDLPAVLELSGNKGLREINLGRTNIGDAEMFALAAIPTLECLTVFQTNVTGPGVQRFKKLRPDVNVVDWYR